MMITLASARSTATPAQERGQRFAPTCVPSRGVHKQYLHRYVATYEAMANAKRVTSHVIRRMCVGARSPHTSYT
jgi:hypothetical protein